MKRSDFIKFLESYGLEFFKHGSRHDIYKHKITGKKVAVPRHGEIANHFLKLIIYEITKTDSGGKS
jgi:predicted RNA binding protein YcfA (HicA-like mRNA interferase family)